jgi:hypothetical protein
MSYGYGELERHFAASSRGGRRRPFGANLSRRLLTFAGADASKRDSRSFRMRVSTVRWTRRSHRDPRDRRGSSEQRSIELRASMREQHRGFYWGGRAWVGTQLLRLERPRMRWPLIATIALAAACDRPAPMKIEDVHVRAKNSPEDASLQSVAFAFTKSASGWASPGPCPTTIPAN